MTCWPYLQLYKTKQKFVDECSQEEEKNSLQQLFPPSLVLKNFSCKNGLNYQMF
jgi:hypothetical protein